jgi:type IX secretion system PorP/SprF family membrane protein
LKRIVKIIALLFIGGNLFSQQVGMYAHYFYKPMFYNPAFTGFDQSANAMLINRTQWAGIKGAPQLNILTVDGNLANNKAGVGATLISDRKGINYRVGGNLSYSYRVEFNETTRLHFGVSLGVIDQTIDYSKASIEDITDPTLFSYAQRKTILDVNAGLAFVMKGLEVGFAIPQLLGNKFNYAGDTDVRTYYTQARHIMGSIKYKFFISEEKGISIAPQALVRIVPKAPLQYDGNLNFEWKDKFWLGATYKSKYAIGINAGIILHKQITIGYAYDVITGNIGKYSGISHEVMLNFRIGKSKKEDVPEENDMNKRIDSLKIELQDLKDKTASNAANNAQKGASNEKLDSLGEELKNTKAKLTALESKVAQQSNSNNNSQGNSNNNNNGNNSNNNNQSNANNNSNNNTNYNPSNSGQQNYSSIDNNASRVMENNVWIISKSSNELKDVNDKKPAKGFYVVGGTYFYRAFAIDEVKRFKSQGFSGATYIFNKPLEFNYVILYKAKSKDDAFQKVNQAKSAGVADAWILSIAE